MRWSKILTGKARPDIDKFLDDFIKEIDEKILRNCVNYCREKIRNIDTELETLLDFYENKIGIIPTRYTLGYLMYTYLEEEDQIKVTKLIMRTHDSWRLFDPCIVLRYMYERYGIDGVEITVVHMILDEIARLCKISFTDARRGVEAMVELLREITREYNIDHILDNVKRKLTNMIIDVAFSIGINFRTITPVRHILLLKKDSEIMSIRKLNNLEICKIDGLCSDKCVDFYNMIRELSKKYKIRVNVRYNPISGILEFPYDSLLITIFRSHRGETSMVYPHVVNVYPVGEIVISIEDYVRDLAMMRPGSMRDDLKGGH